MISVITSIDHRPTWTKRSSVTNYNHTITREIETHSSTRVRILRPACIVYHGYQRFFFLRATGCKIQAAAGLDPLSTTSLTWRGAQPRIRLFKTATSFLHTVTTLFLHNQINTSKITSLQHLLNHFYLLR